MSVPSERRGEIGLAELVAALRRLRCDQFGEAERRAIAEALGFGAADPRAAQTLTPTPTVYDHSQTQAQTRSTPIAPPPAPGWAVPRVAPTPEALPADMLACELVELVADPPDAGDDAQPPTWLSAGYRRIDPQTRAAPLRHALLPARTARGVLTAALATQRTGDEIDHEELVRCLVARRLPPRLPRVLAPTLTHGCQLLLDFSDSMLPWWEDLRQLARQAIAALGAAGVTSFHFSGAPAAARRWSAEREDFASWRPQAGQPVLVATDFGIWGEPLHDGAGADWQDFVRRCAAADSPLLILVPWPPRYWPADLGLFPQLVHWNPATTAAMLRRQRGLAHRVAR